jgi:hypothetical protein
MVAESENPARHADSKKLSLVTPNPSLEAT